MTTVSVTEGRGETKQKNSNIECFAKLKKQPTLVSTLDDPLLFREAKYQRQQLCLSDMAKQQQP
jgi:hypothetical protein